MFDFLIPLVIGSVTRSWTRCFLFALIYAALYAVVIIAKLIEQAPADGTNDVLPYLIGYASVSFAGILVVAFVGHTLRLRFRPARTRHDSGV